MDGGRNRRGATMAAGKTFYDILGVSKSASDKEI